MVGCRHQDSFGRPFLFSLLRGLHSGAENCIAANAIVGVDCVMIEFNFVKIGCGEVLGSSVVT